MTTIGKLARAVTSLQWENARIVRIEWPGLDRDHDLITAWLHLRGGTWGQGFGGRLLSTEDAQRAWKDGVRDILAADGEKTTELIRRDGSPAAPLYLRAGRERRYDSIVAIRPLLADWPVFWPGDELGDRRYLIRLEDFYRATEGQ